MPTEGARRLAAAVVECAVADARGDRQCDRPAAVAWLASHGAEKWLDLIDIPQSTLLMRSGWLDWAREVLPEASPSQQACIQAALDYLESLSRP